MNQFFEQMQNLWIDTVKQLAYDISHQFDLNYDEVIDFVSNKKNDRIDSKNENLSVKREDQVFVKPKLKEKKSSEKVICQFIIDKENDVICGKSIRGKNKIYCAFHSKLNSKIVNALKDESEPGIKNEPLISLSEYGNYITQENYVVDQISGEITGKEIHGCLQDLTESDIENCKALRYKVDTVKCSINSLANDLEKICKH